MRRLAFAVALLLALPASAQALDAPQLFYRHYDPGNTPGVDHTWLPLQGAVVDVLAPAIGVMVGTDDEGKTAGRYVAVTQVPDTAAPDTALGGAHCTVYPNSAGQVVELGPMQFRGFGAYTIHVVAVSNKEAMKGNGCDPSTGVAVDVSFTVSATPTLQTFPDDVRIDDDRSYPGVYPVPSNWSGDTGDFICALNATTGPDGLPAGSPRIVENLKPGIVHFDFPSIGHWSCAGRFEQLSEGDQGYSAGPWGPIFSFDVTDAFRGGVRASLVRGRTYKLSGIAERRAANGGKIRMTVTPGPRCPSARAVKKTLTIGSRGRFAHTFRLPEHGGRAYVTYSWRVRLDFLGTRFVRPDTLKLSLLIAVRTFAGRPRYPRAQVTLTEDPNPTGCVR